MELEANGYFFNPVKGDLSSGTLVLRGVEDLSECETAKCEYF